MFYLLGNLTGQGIQKALNRTFSIDCRIEGNRFAHNHMLTCMLTYVKRDFDIIKVCVGLKVLRA